MEPLLGTITLFAGNFEPKGWAFCNGQSLSIQTHSALFSLLGTTYGGDGVNAFQLPDLRGRVPMHAGQGAGLTPRTAGQTVGAEMVTLMAPQIPTHSHDLYVATVPAHTDHAQGDMLARSQIFAADTKATVALNSLSLSQTGGGLAHDNMQPSLCINFIIALDGVYPSRP